MTPPLEWSFLTFPRQSATPLADKSATGGLNLTDYLKIYNVNLVAAKNRAAKYVQTIHTNICQITIRSSVR